MGKQKTYASYIKKRKEIHPEICTIYILNNRN